MNKDDLVQIKEALEEAYFVKNNILTDVIGISPKEKFSLSKNNLEKSFGDIMNDLYLGNKASEKIVINMYDLICFYTNKGIHFDSLVMNCSAHFFTKKDNESMILNQVVLLSIVPSLIINGKANSICSDSDEYFCDVSCLPQYTETMFVLYDDFIEYISKKGFDLYQVNSFEKAALSFLREGKNISFSVQLDFEATKQKKYC